ncbi:hypothetical protein B0H66DRAFT_530900 [Apodospora peruviana]|uniref:Uncharacterized protein n=1 Tax=Apodospora peruviana TaxID=516989 RepID=A0AAE0IAJ3_9PEZI|nr:hypothetical protein B0H66DRAFT_530900 [Apodospora peruviana]
MPFYPDLSGGSPTEYIYIIHDGRRRILAKPASFAKLMKRASEIFGFTNNATVCAYIKHPCFGDKILEEMELDPSAYEVVKNGVELEWRRVKGGSSPDTSNRWAPPGRWDAVGNRGDGPHYLGYNDPLPSVDLANHAAGGGVRIVSSVYDWGVAPPNRDGWGSAPCWGPAYVPSASRDYRKTPQNINGWAEDWGAASLGQSTLRSESRSEYRRGCGDKNNSWGNEENISSGSGPPPVPAGRAWAIPSIPMKTEPFTMTSERDHLFSPCSHDSTANDKWLRPLPADFRPRRKLGRSNSATPTGREGWAKNVLDDTDNNYFGVLEGW